MKIFKIKGPEVMEDCISSQHYFVGYVFFGFQLNSTNVNIKGLDTHPKEFKYKKYMDEEAAKRLYKKRNEVKID